MSPVLHAYDNERGEGSAHAIKIPLSLENAHQYEMSKDSRLGKWEIGKYVLVEEEVDDGDLPQWWYVASAPCGEGCHCAAVARPADFVGIVVGNTGDRAFLQWIEEADESTVTRDGGSLFFYPPLAVHDDSPGDDRLYIQHSDVDGEAVNIWSPGCGNVAELERRVVRAFGLDVTIDDHGPAEVPTGRGQ